MTAPPRDHPTRRVVGTAAATGLLVAAAVGWVLMPAGPYALGAALPAARFVLDACAVAAVGLGLLGWLVADGQPKDVAAAQARAARMAVVVAAGWAAAALIVLWLQVAQLAQLPVTAVGLDAVTRYVTTFNSGAALLVTAGCAVGYGVVAVATGWRGWPELPTIVALLGLLAAPLTGHASSLAAHELTVLAITAHAGAAAIWVGGLGALVAVVANRRALLATALPRFSGIAAVALGTLTASGVIIAVVQVGSPEALVGTGYGRMVLAKAAALVLLAGIGWSVRRRILPAVRDHRPAPLITFAAAELTVMAAALGLAATLAQAG